MDIELVLTNDVLDTSLKRFKYHNFNMLYMPLKLRKIIYQCTILSLTSAENSSVKAWNKSQFCPIYFKSAQEALKVSGIGP